MTTLNRLTQVTNPLNKTTSYGYDVDGNRTSVTDANGKTTNFTYDGLNRLTHVTDPLLNTHDRTSTTQWATRCASSTPTGT